ncbi:MAG: hypothetical protein LQ349_009452 [Xanthoria aureola]|nr:MAG: hypothetical protein LQ349_009452 [Xanthoria aureola]
MYPHRRCISAPPSLCWRFVRPTSSVSVKSQYPPYHHPPTASRTSSISSFSSSSSSSSSFSLASNENPFQDWEIPPPPSRRQSVTEGIEPYVDPKRYDARPARKVLVEFRTDIWRTEKSDEPVSPLMSPKGTKWADLEKEMEIEVSLRDEDYEAKERRERKKEDERELAAYAEVRRKFGKKARRRKRRDDIPLTCGDGGLLKGTVGLRKKNVDRAGDVKEEEGSLGDWLDIALQSNKTQRQISPERRTLGDGEDLSHDEKSVSNKGSFRTSATSIGRHRKDHGHHSTPIRIWQRDETHRLKRVASSRDLRLMNKRYDLDAESAYSQSTGTLGGKAYSRSLIDFADASYETLTWVTGSLRHKAFQESDRRRGGCWPSETKRSLVACRPRMAQTENATKASTCRYFEQV